MKKYHVIYGVQINDLETIHDFVYSAVRAMGDDVITQLIAYWRKRYLDERDGSVVIKEKYLLQLTDPRFDSNRPPTIIIDEKKEGDTVVNDITIFFHDGKRVEGRLLRRSGDHPKLHRPDDAIELFRNMVIEILGQSGGNPEDLTDR